MKQRQCYLEAGGAEPMRRQDGFRGMRQVSTAAMLLCLSLSAHAAPQGGQISAGSGSISRDDTTTVITQSSARLAIDWRSFNSSAAESIVFIQPSRDSVALNRVLGQSPSELLGRLSANGQVFILNPNGVLFGRGAQVDVGGLVATSLDLSNRDFMEQRLTFTGSAARGSVSNLGQISSSPEGYVALLAPQVRNQGSIVAAQGGALLAAGEQVTIRLSASSLVGYSIDRGTVQALVDNAGLVQTDAGQAILTARAAEVLGNAVVNNSGVVRARTVLNQNGVITLLSDMHSGSVTVSGTLDASAPDTGSGGFIETSAARVTISDSARISTLARNGASGQWLIDPNDFVIAPLGGDISGASLSNALSGGNVVIQSTAGAAGGQGDVLVNDVVNWSANRLTLNAQHSIRINANLNGSASASLALQYGQASATGDVNDDFFIAQGVKVNLPAGSHLSTQKGNAGAETDYVVINSLGAEGSTTGSDLQGMNGCPGCNYALGADIDASATASWNAGAGFESIGSFGGQFTGLGHTVSFLTINRPDQDGVGLFSSASFATLRDVELRNVNITGRDFVGGLIGELDNTEIQNASVSGSVTGRNFVGGLAGYQFSSNIAKSQASARVHATSYSAGGLVGLSEYSGVTDAYATGDVSGDLQAGGLIGGMTGGLVSNGFASGNVTAGDYAGGLVGYMDSRGSVTASFATGNVQGANFVGGLVGANGYSGAEGGAISRSYAIGNVTGTASVGGLAGYSNGLITNSYATGSVTGTDNIGGLVGEVHSSISSDPKGVQYTYATGLVRGTGINVGGLVGLNDGGSDAPVSTSFWNIQTTGQAASGGGLGKSTADMMTESTYSGWDIDSTAGTGKAWRIYPDATTPLLRNFLAPLTIDAGNVSLPYTGQAYVLTFNVPALQAPGQVLGAVTTGTEPGTYPVQGLYSLQNSGYLARVQNYDIAYSGSLTIVPTAVPAPPPSFPTAGAPVAEQTSLVIGEMQGDMCNQLRITGHEAFLEGATMAQTDGEARSARSRLSNTFLCEIEYKAAGIKLRVDRGVAQLENQER